MYNANEDFFLGRPTVDGLVFVTVKDAALSLLAGEVERSRLSGRASRR